MTANSQIMILMKSYGLWWYTSQHFVPWSEKNFGYLDYYRKGYENETDPAAKDAALACLQQQEARRDFHTASMKQINHLIQFDPEPNTELREARWELYKISVPMIFKGRNFLHTIERY